MSEHRFRQLDQAWARSQDKPVTLKPDYAMTQQWRRMGPYYAPCGNTRQVHNWRMMNALQATRLRVTPRL